MRAEFAIVSVHSLSILFGLFLFLCSFLLLQLRIEVLSKKEFILKIVRAILNILSQIKLWYQLTNYMTIPFILKFIPFKD